MNHPFPSSHFARGASLAGTRCVEGLDEAIDRVAEAARPSHAFLRRGWFDAAIQAYGGTAHTLSVHRDGQTMAALPFVPLGPAALKLASVPGCYWPFRSFPVHANADPDIAAALLSALQPRVTALRLGPIYDDDPALLLLREAAKASGWAPIDRFVSESHVLDMAALRAEGAWPRNSTLRKNRHLEKHLAAKGSLAWQFASGADWNDALFDALATIETRSWIAERTDGSDAKFTAEGHSRFWRAAARDPLLGARMQAALLRVDGQPVAFSFDVDAGTLKYAVANSYDRAFAKHSPGKLLYYRNLMHALDRGTTRVDWGAGDSNYKRVIGATPGPAIRDWLFVRPGLPAFGARRLHALWRRSGNPEPIPGTTIDPEALTPGEDRDL